MSELKSSPSVSRARSADGNSTMSIRSVSKTLSALRRDKLVALRNREEIKGLLVDRLGQRYGSQRKNKNLEPDLCSVTNTALNQEVEKFMDKASLTQENLIRLERRMQQRAKKLSGAAPSHPSVVSAYSQSHAASSSFLAPTQSAISTDCTQDRANVKPLLDRAAKDGWTKIGQYNKLLGDHEMVLKRLGVKENQKKMRSELDRQVREAQALRYKQARSDLAFHETQVVGQLQKWRESEVQKEKELQRKILDAKENHEKLRLQKQYQQELEHALEAEKQREREHVKKEMYHALRQNAEEVRAEKQAQADAETEWEQRINREASTYAAEQDRRRDEAKNARFKQLEEREQILKKLMENGKGWAKDRGKDMSECKQKEVRSAEQEQSIQNWRQGLREDTKKYLLAKIKENNDKREATRKSDKEFYSKFTQDAEAAALEALRSQEETRLRHIQNRAELEKQIETRRNTENMQMSKEEVFLNRQLLENCDKVLG